MQNSSRKIMHYLKFCGFRFLINHIFNIFIFYFSQNYAKNSGFTFDAL